MAIITKPTNVYKNFENVYTVSVSELLLHPKVSVDSYFNNQSNWQTVFIVYKAVGSNQIENVEFEIAEAQTTGLFEITDVGRTDWEIQALFIQDFDRGYLRLEREDLDFASLDFTALPPPLEGVPTLNLVNISPVTANVNNSEVITLLFTSLESLQNVSATIAGQTAIVTGSGTSWQADYMLTGIEPAGNVSFTIDFQDILGQQGVTAASTTDGSSTNIEYDQGSLSPVSIASSNLDNTTAVEGDTITVSFTASDTIQNVTSTIIGKTATVNNVSLNNWTASYTLTATEAQNIATFTINYEDQFGISQTQATSVTDGSQVLIDTILPTLSPVSIASDNFDPSSAQAGDIITVSFTSSETIQNVTGSILGNVATVSNISGNNWELSYTTSLGDSVGLVPFIINFQDSLLNSGVQVNSTTDGTSVTYSAPLGVDPIFLKTLASYVSSASRFGASVAQSGDTIVVGDDGDNGSTGRVHIFERNLDGVENWGLRKTIISPSSDTGDAFGTSVAISGDTIVVGAFLDDGSTDTIVNAGEAYVFERNHNGSNFWGVIKALNSTSEDENDRFGTSVSISGDTIVIGASSDDGSTDGIVDAGEAYVYERNLGGVENWGFVTTLNSSNEDVNDEFGYSVVISGDIIVVGAPDDDGSTDTIVRAGEAYMFERNLGGTDNWGLIKTLNSPNEDPTGRFGWSVAISGDTLVVGVPEFLGDSGEAYVFNRNEGGADNWGSVATLNSTNINADDRFGSSVAISGDTIAVGAFAKDTSTGEAYVFSRNLGGPDSWDLVTTLNYASEDVGNAFGWSVAVSGDIISVGAKNATGPTDVLVPVLNSGIVNIYKII